MSVAGCTVAAGTPGVAAANPGLQSRQFRLESGLSIYCSRALFLETPTARLAGAPNHQVDGSNAGIEGMKAVPAERIDHDVFSIGLANSGGPVVCLEDMPPI